MEAPILVRQEGVVKFQLRFTPTPPPSEGTLKEVNAWRKILFLMKLVGRDPDRYGGYGYGNVSCRLGQRAASKRAFLITGTQTGGYSELNRSHYAVVRECRPGENLVVAEGPLPPSSEALTHGMVYASDPAIRVVMHVHSPEIWRSAGLLGLPTTPKWAPYGSLELAEAVRDILKDPEVRSRGIFAMGGHEDGIVSFGRTARRAGTVLIGTLVRAFKLMQA